MGHVYHYSHIPQARHSGRDSRQAVLPDALRVNANLFQTDLCRNPEHMDVKLSADTSCRSSFCMASKLPSMALDSGIPAGMTTFLSSTEIGYNDERLSVRALHK
jgi:hypothetical protein